MSAPTVPGPAPVVGWDISREAWLKARRRGLGGSDVTAILGFSPYRSPWQVWAEKLDVRRPPDLPSDAADLGVALEPWLLEQAGVLLGQPVARTEAQLYRHPEHPWRLCSPDGRTVAGNTGIELKTAGLASGFGSPKGWADGAVPLGYEFQVRWQMHVMGWDAVEVVALVANMGLVRRTVVRDLAVEADLVAQASEWWERHIIGRVEPPLGAVDSPILGDLFPNTTGETVDLPPAAIEPWMAYRDAREREKAAKTDKEAAAAALKHLMRDAQFGKVDGHLICVWGEVAGKVDWPRLLADYAEQTGVAPPSPDMYRKPPSRSLTVKD